MLPLSNVPVLRAKAGFNRLGIGLLIGICGVMMSACKPADDRDPKSEASAGVDTLPSGGGTADEDDGAGLDGLDQRFDQGPTPDWGADGGDDGGADEGAKDRKCDIDFLFVIDNSGTMSSEQAGLTASVPEFVTTVTQEIPNLETFHLAVVTTQAYRENGPGCQEMGGMVTQTGTALSSNRQCTPYAAGGSYMTQDDDLLDKFDCAARPGTGDNQYGDERPMQALELALSGPNVEADGCNAGFLRRDSLLVVTIITDEEDDHVDAGGTMLGSPGEPADWHKALLATKDDRESMVVVLGLIGTQASTECGELLPTGMGEGNFDGAEISPRLESFVKLFGDRGFIGDVCAPNYDPFFEKALAVIDFACEHIDPPG